MWEKISIRASGSLMKHPPWSISFLAAVVAGPLIIEFEGGGRILLSEPAHVNCGNASRQPAVEEPASLFPS